MKHCCVIGGTGFIGSHVVRLLGATNRHVTVIGRSAQPTRPLPDDVRYVVGDYGDKSFLMQAMAGVDEVIDLAYSSVPKTSFDDPVLDIMSNLPPSVQLFEIAALMRVSKVVVVSSGGTVYGVAQNLPIDENHSNNPISPYGITKLAIEKYGLMFNALNQLPVVIVRPGNAYGRGQLPFSGQGFIATAIASVLSGSPVNLYGENGTIRDYVHVLDVAHGILSVLEQGVPGSCYNLGSGVGRSNRDIVEVITELAHREGLKLAVNCLPPRKFDVPINVLDSSRLNHDTGWTCKIPFAEGIEDAWNSLHNLKNMDIPI